MQKKSKGAHPRERAREEHAKKTAAHKPARETLIDRHLPVADIIESRTIIVDMPPEATHAALHRIDFAKVPSLLMRAMMAIGVRAIDRARRRAGRAPLARPIKFTLGNLEQYGRILLEDKPGEIVIGVIERPGDMASMLERRTPEEFDAFDCPGHVKAAASFQMAPHGAGQTLLTYEVRVRATDTATRRRAFLRDMLTAPLMRLGMKRVLEHVKAVTERECAAKKGHAEKHDS